MTTLRVRSIFYAHTGVAIYCLTCGILDGFGQVKDHASARLSEIRRELSSAASGISRSLNSILRKAGAESGGRFDADGFEAAHDAEWAVVSKLMEFPQVVRDCLGI